MYFWFFWVIIPGSTKWLLQTVSRSSLLEVLRWQTCSGNWDLSSCMQSWAKPDELSKSLLQKEKIFPEFQCSLYFLKVIYQVFVGFFDRKKYQNNRKLKGYIHSLWNGWVSLALVEHQVLISIIALLVSSL